MLEQNMSSRQCSTPLIVSDERRIGVRESTSKRFTPHNAIERHLRVAAKMLLLLPLLCVNCGNNHILFDTWLNDESAFRRHSHILCFVCVRASFTILLGCFTMNIEWCLYILGAHFVYNQHYL